MADQFTEFKKCITWYKSQDAWCGLFDVEKTDPINIRDEHFEKLFDEAKEKHPLTSEMRNKLEEMDQYIIEHFRISFGNRIMRQIEEFVPSFIACGGTEVDAID